MKYNDINREDNLGGYPTSRMDLDGASRIGPTIGRNLVELETLIRLLPNGSQILPKLHELKTLISSVVPISSRMVETSPDEEFDRPRAGYVYKYDPSVSVKDLEIVIRGIGRYSVGGLPGKIAREAKSVKAVLDDISRSEANGESYAENRDDYKKLNFWITQMTRSANALYDGLIEIGIKTGVSTDISENVSPYMGSPDEIIRACRKVSMAIDAVTPPDASSSGIDKSRMRDLIVAARELSNACNQLGKDLLVVTTTKDMERNSSLREQHLQTPVSPSVSALEKKLISMKKSGKGLDYGSIDAAMKEIGSNYGVTMNDLHNMWVASHGGWTPDDWAKNSPDIVDNTLHESQQMEEGIINWIREKLGPYFNKSKEKLASILKDKNIPASLDDIQRLYYELGTQITIELNDLEPATKDDVNAQNKLIKDAILKILPGLRNNKEVDDLVSHFRIGILGSLYSLTQPQGGYVASLMPLVTIGLWLATRKQMASEDIDQLIKDADVVEMYETMRVGLGDKSWVAITKRLRSQGYPADLVESMIDRAVVMTKKS